MVFVVYYLTKYCEKNARNQTKKFKCGKQQKEKAGCLIMKDFDYVFTDEMGNRFKPRYLEDAFPKILERNGLHKIRFHDLRHTCASPMHKMGLSPKEVQDYLGHSTVSVTPNIYTHLDRSSKENAAKAMEVFCAQVPARKAGPKA